ncbi:MAG: hypothetical protein HQM08_29330 [Candidatus Riflebacteria bacterium]|nr:hypothetical protein [Candidatus Riflebacteria bacterium]
MKKLTMVFFLLAFSLPVFSEVNPDLPPFPNVPQGAVTMKGLNFEPGLLSYQALDDLANQTAHAILGTVPSDTPILLARSGAISPTDIAEYNGMLERIGYHQAGLAKELTKLSPKGKSSLMANPAIDQLPSLAPYFRLVSLFQKDLEAQGVDITPDTEAFETLVAKYLLPKPTSFAGDFPGKNSKLREELNNALSNIDSPYVKLTGLIEPDLKAIEIHSKEIAAIEKELKEAKKAQREDLEGQLKKEKAELAEVQKKISVAQFHMQKLEGINDELHGKDAKNIWIVDGLMSQLLCNKAYVVSLRCNLMGGSNRSWRSFLKPPRIQHLGGAVVQYKIFSNDGTLKSCDVISDYRGPFSISKK